MTTINAVGDSSDANVGTASAFVNPDQYARLSGPHPAAAKSNSWRSPWAGEPVRLYPKLPDSLPTFPTNKINRSPLHYAGKQGASISAQASYAYDPRVQRDADFQALVIKHTRGSEWSGNIDRRNAIRRELRPQAKEIEAGFVPAAAAAAAQRVAASEFPSSGVGAEEVAAETATDGSGGVLKSATAFNLKSGNQLSELQIQWEQYGTPDQSGEYFGSNTILLLPSFSHSSHCSSHPENDTTGWWEFMVGPGKYIDTTKWHVICPSVLGAPYGTTSSNTVDPDTRKLHNNFVGLEYGTDFPQVTMEDVVNCHSRLLDVLGFEKIFAAVGCSFGGMQSLQFAAMYPHRVEKVATICGTSKTSPATMSVRMLQREAIALADAAGFPKRGQALAKKIATLYYRSTEDINEKCDWYSTRKPDRNDARGNSDSSDEPLPYFEIEKYMNHVAEKSLDYDLNCYLNLSTCMDMMDLGAMIDTSDINNADDLAVRTNGEYTQLCEFRKASAFDRLADNAAGRSPDMMVMGVKQDRLIPIDEQRDIYNSLRALGKKNVEMHEIDSQAGHDAVFVPKNGSLFGPQLQEFLERGREFELCPKEFSTDASASVDAQFNEYMTLASRLAKSMSPESDLSLAQRYGRKNGTVDFLETHVLGEDSGAVLPFDIPAESWLRKIGGLQNSPVVKLDDVEGVSDVEIYAKLEGMNHTGSVKDKAITNIILQMYMNQKLDPQGDTVGLVTSGWAGVALVNLHGTLAGMRLNGNAPPPASGEVGAEKLRLSVMAVMPLNYAEREIPAYLLAHECNDIMVHRDGFEGFLLHYREVLGIPENETPTPEDRQRFGALDGKCHLILEKGVFSECNATTREYAEKYSWGLVDQQYDKAGYEVHKSTADEILQSVPGVTDVVCSTGTGATAAGLRHYLPEDVRVHCRRSISGQIDGITDVNMYGNFCTDIVENKTKGGLMGYQECEHFKREDALVGARELREKYGVVAGLSGGVSFWLAKQVANEATAGGVDGHQVKKVVFVSADARQL